MRIIFELKWVYICLQNNYLCNLLHILKSYWYDGILFCVNYKPDLPNSNKQI